MKMTRYAVAASAALSMGIVGFGAAGAGASPSHAPSAQTGTFTCPGGPSGTFTVNSGNSHAAQVWGVAHLIFDGGGTGNFVPSELNLTIMSGGMTFTSDSIKGNAPGSVTCSISESSPGFSLSGIVTGTIVVTG
jgi:hypothetical protein